MKRLSYSRYKNRFGLITILIFYALLSFLNAQDIFSDRLWFERIRTEDGLSSSWVAAIAQDSLGYLWFGTQDGLVRYNGYEFITYRYETEDSTSLDNNRVETLFVSSDGTLWVGTVSGVNRYREETDDFERFVYQSNISNGLAPGQINDFVEDKQGYIWWGTQASGLVRFNSSSQQAERLLIDTTATDHLLNDQVRVLMFDRTGLLWIGTGEPSQSSDKAGGLIRYNPLTKEIRRFKHEIGHEFSLTDNRIGSLLQDSRGRIWIGTAKAGLHLYDVETESFFRFVAQTEDTHALHAPVAQTYSTWNLDELVKILHEDQAGRIWVGTVNAGLNVYDPKHHLLKHYQHEVGNPFSLTNNLVWSFFEDDQGRIWIGNFLAGLHKIDPATRKFQYLQHNPFKMNSLTENDVVGLSASKSRPEVIWVATRFRGLNRVDLSRGEIQHFRHQPNKSNSLGSDGLWTVYEDRQGIVWIGTSNGLDRYDPSFQTFEHFRHEAHNLNSLSGNTIISILQDSQGSIWAGTYGDGLNRFDQTKQKIRRYNFVESGEVVDNIVFVNSHFLIHEDRQGNIWTTSWRGSLYRYLAETDEFQKYPALDNVGGNCLYEDEKGNFWIGTNDRGLIVFNPENGKILKKIEESDGLPSNMILSILSDEKEHLWLSTDKGLCQFHMVTGQIKNYGIQDGLPSNTFNYQGGTKTLDGYYFFGSDNGLVFFQDHLAENTNPPHPYITSLNTVNRVSGINEQIHYGTVLKPEKPLNLPFSQRDFTINYLGLHYTNPLKNTYRYKLEPYETNWIYNNTKRTTRYTNLNPGQYTFQVQAANSDGYWSTETASLSLIILPPWWDTTLAYLIYFILGCIFFYIGYRIIIDRERQRNAILIKEAEAAQLRETDQMKSRFFTNISHEFRTPLTLIQGPVEDLLEGRIKDGVENQYQLILKNVKRLRQLINQLLDLARIDNGQEKLESSNKDLISFLRAIFSSFEPISQNQDIEMTFFSEWKSFQTTFDEDKLEKICINLLSNAFKFTPHGGSVLFYIGSPKHDHLLPQQNGVLLRITDTGMGIPHDQLPYIFNYFYQGDNSQTRKFEGSGIGLSLVKQYVELYNGKISVVSELKRGTTFSIFLPLHQDNILQSPNSTVEEISFPSIKGNAQTISSPNDLQTHLPQKKKSKASTNLPTILLVEDNTDMRMHIKYGLSSNYALLEAANGKKGLEIAIEQIPDLIISDVMMPIMDGFEFCKVLRTNPCTSHIPIVLLTARAEVSDQLQGIEYGADAYLIKPFNREELNIRVTKLIEHREILRQKFSNKSTLKPVDLNISSLDKQFLNKLIEFIEAEISNEQISLLDLSTALGMSRSQMHRKLKALTGESPGDFLRRFRLQRAAQLLKTSQLNVSEIAFMVGFRSHSHFSQAFRRYYKISPSDYNEKNSKV